MGLIAILSLLIALWSVQGAVLRPDHVFFGVDTGSAHLPWSGVDGETARVQNPALSDQGVVFYPFYRWVSRSWRAGDPPAWCPWIYAGAPGFGNAQAGGLDPQVLLPVLLEALFGPVAFDWGLGFLAWLRIAFALSGAYVLARRLGLAPGPSALCGVTFGLSGYLALWLNHQLGHVPPFLPWLLVFLEGIRGGAPRRSMAAAASMMALAILGGHVETAFFVGVAGGLWALALLREDGVAGLRALTALALGTACAAISLLPLTEYLGLSAAQVVRQAEAEVAERHVDLVSLGALIAVVGIVSGFGRHVLRRSAPGADRSASLVPAAVGVVLALGGVAFLLVRRGLGVAPALALVPDLFGAPGSGGYRGPGNYLEAASAWVPGIVLFAALAALLSSRGVVRRRGLIATLGVVSFLLSIELPGLLGLYRFVPLVGLGDTVRFASVGSLMLGLLAADGLQSAPRVSRIVAVIVITGFTFAALSPRGRDALDAKIERGPEESELVGFVTTPPEVIDGVHTSLEGWWHGSLQVHGARVRIQPIGADGAPLAEPPAMSIPLELFDAASARAQRTAPMDVARAPAEAIWFRTALLPTGMLPDGYWVTTLELLGVDPRGGPVATRRVRVSTIDHSIDRRPFTLLLVLAGALVVLIPYRRGVAGWIGAAVALAAGLHFIDGVHPLVPRSQSFPPTRTEAILAAELGPYRFFSDPDVFPPDTGLVRGLRAIEGYDAMDVAVFNDYRGYVLPPGVNPLLAWHPRSVDLTHPAFRLYGVGMLALREPFAHPDWELVASPEHAKEARRAETWLYRARDPMPRAFCVAKVVSLDELGDLVRTDVQSWDPASLASYAGDWRPSMSFTEAFVGVPTWTNNTVTVDVALDGEGLLVLTDQHFPGWTVTVDGEAAELAAANMIFRGVPLQAGVHEVVFRYQPNSIRLGLLISAAAGACVVALFVLGRR